MNTHSPKLRLALVVAAAVGFAGLVIWDQGRSGPGALPTATAPEVQTAKRAAKKPAASKAASRDREPAPAPVSVGQADM